MNEKKQRELRKFDIELRSNEEEMTVEGYAIVFNQPTVIAEFDNIKYYEEIDRKALTNTDLSDVIMNYNHGGKVVARLRNNTLTLHSDDYGLKIKANLSGTEEGRKLYEEIKGGYIDRMSFAFTCSDEKYNSETRTRTILGIKKLYDVSAVDVPAYEATCLSARSLFEVEYSKEMELEVVQQRKTELLNRLEKLCKKN